MQGMASVDLALEVRVAQVDLAAMVATLRVESASVLDWAVPLDVAAVLELTRLASEGLAV